MYRTLHQPPREKQSPSTFMITVWALKEGEKQMSWHLQWDLGSWKAPSTSQCFARKRKQQLIGKSDFCVPVSRVQVVPRYCSQQQIQEVKNTQPKGKRREATSTEPSLKLQLLKKLKPVLAREDGAYCERAIQITSQLLSFSKLRDLFR